jgi:hypothetical protein
MFARVSLVLVAVLFFAGVLVFFLLLGKLTWGTGEDLVDWDPVGRARRRRALDLEDTEDMLELTNLRRRERGLAELTPEEVLGGLQEHGRWQDSPKGS